MITVFIVEDHQLIVEGLQTLLQEEKDICIKGCASTAEDCMHFLKNNTIDIILMDISLPDKSGIDLCKEVKDKYPLINILALSTFSQGSYMQKMMENGASGYLLKNIGKNELRDAIVTAAQNGIYFSIEAGKTYREALKKNSEAPMLTKREKEVLKLITEGFTNIQIGQKLFISVDTVDTHRKNLYTKLGVNNTAMLIRYAIENELL